MWADFGCRWPRMGLGSNVIDRESGIARAVCSYLLLQARYVMRLVEPGAFSSHDLLEMYPDMSHEVFYLCASRYFQVRFGVFLGESICSSEMMNAGDIYKISHEANWLEVFRLSEDRSVFSLPTHTDRYTLEPYAHLIFMSESGQAFDVWPVRISGIDHIVTNAPFQFCEEYSLIEIHDAPPGPAGAPVQGSSRRHSLP